MDKKNKKENEEKTLNEIIVDETVKRFKERKIKSATDVTNFLDDLFQPIMQSLLDAELDIHVQHEKYEHSDNSNTNYRNGHCKPKKVETKYGGITVETPRDRNGTFAPIIIEKGQTKLDGFEEKCILLYSKGVSTRDIADILNDVYKVKMTKDDVTKLVSVVNNEVIDWQNRPLKSCYVFAYADCLYVPIKEDLVSQKEAIYTIIGVDVNGYKEVLGLWIDHTESASFWSNVFEDLKSRGVEDIFYMTSDGIAGFKGSLESAFPKTNPQRCVVHLTRNIHELCPRKKAKEYINGWKEIYTSSSYEEAELKLEEFKEKFKDHPVIVKKVEEFMQYLEILLELPTEIRQAIYTSNAVESVNSALRKVTRGKGSFPSRESVIKVMYLRINELTEKWNKPIKNWNNIQVQLIKLFGERYTQYLDI